jgi:Lon protease-like protein
VTQPLSPFRPPARGVYVSGVSSPRPDLLPLFPLPLVLFPGTPLPLHIFEPRYRTMLADCVAGDQRFGLIALPKDMKETDIPRGTVGCIAEIVETRELPDGRSDIVVRGVTRFALAGLVRATRPYLLAQIEPYSDETEFCEEIEEFDSRVREVFTAVGNAARVLASDSDPLPELPADSALLSFVVASMIDLDLGVRQELLASRSPAERLRRLDEILSAALPDLAERAEVHRRAKANGKGAHAAP